MSGQVQRVEADCQPVLRAASYNPLSSSWPRDQMRIPNPVSAVIPLIPNHLYQKFAVTFKKGSKTVTGMLYNNHTVRMLTFWCSEMCPKLGLIPCCPSHTAAQDPALSSSCLSKE